MANVLVNLIINSIHSRLAKDYKSPGVRAGSIEILTLVY